MDPNVSGTVGGGGYVFKTVKMITLNISSNLLKYSSMKNKNIRNIFNKSFTQ